MGNILKRNHADTNIAAPKSKCDRSEITNRYSYNKISQELWEKWFIKITSSNKINQVVINEMWLKTDVIDSWQTAKTREKIESRKQVSYAVCMRQGYRFFNCTLSASSRRTHTNTRTHRHAQSLCLPTVSDTTHIRHWMPLGNFLKV